MKRYLITLLISSHVALCGADDLMKGKKLTMGGFPDVSHLDDFIRGVTTEAEVLNKLGIPSGRGGALFAPDYRERFILYYENVEVENARYVAATPNTPKHLRFDSTQEILGVLILEGRFDGFLWYKNVRQPEARYDTDVPMQ